MASFFLFFYAILRGNKRREEAHLMSTKKLRNRLTLKSTILLLVFVVVVLSLLVTDLLVHRSIEEEVEENQTNKAQQLAKVVALTPIVQEALIEEEATSVQSYIETLMDETDVQFIVVMNMDGIRYAHPEREKVGAHFVGGDEQTVLTTGEESLSISEGTLGRSLRAFTPVHNEQQQQIGAVAVGISLDKVEEAVSANRTNLFIGTFFGLLVGLVGAIWLASYIKRTLFNLEPKAIATLLEERSAMLQSTIEGMIAVDATGSITLVNKSAQTIFERAGLPPNAVGVKVETYMQNSRLRHVIESGKPEYNQEQSLNNLTIVVNRVPVHLNNHIIGAIATFRDKTEMKQLAEQLTGVKTYASTLRSQTHEFMNRMQIILGMLHSKEYEKLESYVQQITGNQLVEVNEVTIKLKEPVLAGLLLGKKSYARERGVELDISIDTAIQSFATNEQALELTTILGNLIDNALDAVVNQENGVVRLKLFVIEEELIIYISDNGPGMNADELQNMYEQGYSTKGLNRGYGLSLVKQSVEHVQGSMTVQSEKGQGTTFAVFMPMTERKRSDTDD